MGSEDPTELGRKERFNADGRRDIWELVAWGMVVGMVAETLSKWH